MIEIHQHQPAREQQVEHRPPALLVGKQLIPVEQHQLVGLRPDQRNRRIAERISAEHLAVGVDHMLAVRRRVAQHAERGTDNRRAVLARDM